MNLIEPIAGKAKTGIWGLDDILSGDNNLISIRSRATMNRPFTRIR